jgi:hypothetical protein
VIHPAPHRWRWLLIWWELQIATRLLSNTRVPRAEPSAGRGSMALDGTASRPANYTEVKLTSGRIACV